MWTLAERWETPAGFPMSIVRRLRFCISTPPPLPPPTSNDRPPFTHSQSAHRAFHQERWRTLQIFDMSKNVRDSLHSRRRPTTYNGHLAPLLRPSTSSAPSSWTLDELWAERCIVRQCLVWLSSGSVGTASVSFTRGRHLTRSCSRQGAERTCCPYVPRSSSHEAAAAFNIPSPSWDPSETVHSKVELFNQ